jgi:hypothetical protein
MDAAGRPRLTTAAVIEAEKDGAARSLRTLGIVMK